MTARRGAAARGGRAYCAREAAELAALVATLAIANAFVSVPVWLLVGLPAAKIVASAAFFALFLRRAFRRPVRGGPADLVGRTAVAATPLRPGGRIRIDGESWAARSADGRTIGRHQTVDVVDVRDRTVLVVRRTDSEGERPPPSGCWNSREAS